MNYQGLSNVSKSYASLGIQDVFLSQTSTTEGDFSHTDHKTRPVQEQESIQLNAKSNVSFEPDVSKLFTSFEFTLTQEVIGQIKKSPEDFIVRELASRKLHLHPNLNVASLNVQDPMLSERMTENTSEAVIPNSNSNDNVMKETCEKESSREIEQDSDPFAIVRKVLEAHHIDTCELELSELQKLHELGLSQLRELCTYQSSNCQKESKVSSIILQPGNHDNVVWIPHIPSDKSCLLQGDNKGLSSNDIDLSEIRYKGDRGLFHRHLKLCFPLLQSETISTQEMSVSMIAVRMDTSFFELASYVHPPVVDTLLSLYKFRNLGAPLIIDSDRHSDTLKRKRNRRNNPYIDDPSSFVLPLRPGLSKDERRKLHHMISSASRDFETSTISEYKVKDSSGDVAGETSAMLLRWSKSVLRAASTSGLKKVSKSHLFVLKKRQREHLAAMQVLSRAFNCRQSDLGTAGMKDMQAITFQFCTVRNVDLPHILLNVNTELQYQGMEIGNVQAVSHFLQPGELEGNHFKIVVRGLKRVQNCWNHGLLSEVFRPWQESDQIHIRNRVHALQQYGFINFYGEQRLGIPGTTADVGVRSFDIGRAMLQGDFDKAVDLLMTGRMHCFRGSDGREEENPSVSNCRQVWKDTGGNADEAFKALPKGDAMIRERIVLQGLKRYKNSLEALKCLHFRDRVFWIHAYQSYIWNIMASERLLRFGNKVIAGDLILGEDGKAKIVTDVTDIELYQVVLPLPGYNVQYPANEIGDLYGTYLQQEGVKFDKNATIESTAKGSYRHLVVDVKDIELNFIASSAIEDEAFQLTFTLPSGSYATMLLRELMFTTVWRS